jgi:hypothetical protein
MEMGIYIGGLKKKALVNVERRDYIKMADLFTRRKK